MIYLSWDIGEKNLAYSIILYNPLFPLYIIDFDLINIHEEYKNNGGVIKNNKKLNINDITKTLLKILDRLFYIFVGCQNIKYNIY
jgi:hypothetical protein